MDSFIFELGYIQWYKEEFQSKIITRIANGVDPDMTIRYEPYHLDLQSFKSVTACTFVTGGIYANMFVLSVSCSIPHA